jgi:hypothetical protein
MVHLPEAMESPTVMQETWLQALSGAWMLMYVKRGKSASVYLISLREWMRLIRI